MKARVWKVAGILGILLMVAAACTPFPPDNENPFATFVPDVSNGPAALTVNLDASSSGDPDGTIMQYGWDFGDFTTGAGQTINHTFTTGGQYTVTPLTVTDNDGATASSITAISVTGGPTTYPTNLQRTGAGCCHTYGDFSWNQMPGVTRYEIKLDAFFGGGCVTGHSATIAAPASSGRVQAFGRCLGPRYDVSIRAEANGIWGPWSPRHSHQSLSESLTRVP